MWWVDDSGHPVDQERPKLRIGAGNELKVQAKSGDCWLVRGRNGADIGFFQAEDKPVRGEVDQLAVDAAPKPQIGNLLEVPDILPRSKNIGDIVEAITVVNKANQLITLQWLDGEGRPVSAPGKVRIPPGEERTWYTWPGHYWLVRTQSDDNICLIRAQLKPMITEVDQEALDRVSLHPKDG